LSQASAILAREAQRLSLTSLGAPAQFPSAVTPGTPSDVQDLAGSVGPITKPVVPFGGFDQDRLRKQAYDFIETLLTTLNEGSGRKGLGAEAKVPQLQCEAPVQSGSEARALLTVANEESTPSDVALYCTNFVADSGHEIPSFRVAISPRRVTIPAHGEATFQIGIAVSQQASAGIYSGLIQAAGSKYIKAVLSLEVL
jgi:hypothetical protein